MWIYIIIAIIILIVIYALALYNSFVKLNNKVKEAFSTMDVYLKKRWDLIPNIVETVKGYAKHEKDTLKEVVELRNSTYDKMSDDGLYQDAETGLTFSFNTYDVIKEKTQYALENGLGGMMIWHYACDVPADNENSLFGAIDSAKQEFIKTNN